MNESDKIFLMEIFQPFAQYRNPFTFYYAQTYPLPPKSTIIGMLQNAQNDWYGNNNGVENWWNLKVSVHGGFESVFWNYQQLIKGDIDLIKKKDEIKLWNQELPLYSKNLKSQRTPVYQQELFNGHLYIFLRGDGNFLNKIYDSLAKPTKILYLGRSEDLVFIKDIVEIKPVAQEGQNEGLWLSYPMYIKSCNFPIKNEKFPVYSIPTKTKLMTNNNILKHKAEITSSTERAVEFTSIIYSGFDNIVYLSSRIEVEIFEYKGYKFKIPLEWGWL